MKFIRDTLLVAIQLAAIALVSIFIFEYIDGNIKCIDNIVKYCIIRID